MLCPTLENAPLDLAKIGVKWNTSVLRASNKAGKMKSLTG